jgi:hypothetical protein
MSKLGRFVQTVGLAIVGVAIYDHHLQNKKADQELRTDLKELLEVAKEDGLITK